MMITDKAKENRIVAVKTFNRIFQQHWKYMTDKEQFGRPEFWTESAKLIGDCDDNAMTLYTQLLSYAPAACFRFAACYVFPDRMRMLPPAAGTYNHLVLLFHPAALDVELLDETLVASVGMPEMFTLREYLTHYAWSQGWKITARGCKLLRWYDYSFSAN